MCTEWLLHLSTDAACCLLLPGYVVALGWACSLLLWLVKTSKYQISGLYSREPLFHYRASPFWRDTHYRAAGVDHVVVSFPLVLFLWLRVGELSLRAGGGQTDSGVVRHSLTVDLEPLFSWMCRSCCRAWLILPNFRFHVGFYSEVHLSFLAGYSLLQRPIDRWIHLPVGPQCRWLPLSGLPANFLPWKGGGLG